MSNPPGRSCKDHLRAGASPDAVVSCSAAGRIRTCTGRVLSALPLPLGYRGVRIRGVEPGSNGFAGHPTTVVTWAVPPAGVEPAFPASDAGVLSTGRQGLARAAANSPGKCAEDAGFEPARRSHTDYRFRDGCLTGLGQSSFGVTLPLRMGGAGMRCAAIRTDRECAVPLPGFEPGPDAF